MANALTFPLALSEFFDRCFAETVVFDLTENRRISETGGGEILTADLGPRLWEGRVVHYSRKHADSTVLSARLNTLREAGRTFMVYDQRRGFPVADPGAAILGVSSPTIGSLNTDGRRLTVTGLPAGYVLTEGDYLAFTYGVSPTRFALHQIVTPVTANGSGVTPLFEVTPAIRPGAQVGTAVDLTKPACKAVILPGSVEPVSRGRSFSTGITYAWRQTLR